MIYPKKKTKKDHHEPKKIIAADRPHPHFRHFMVEKYEIKVYLNLLKLTKYERFRAATELQGLWTIVCTPVEP